MRRGSLPFHLLVPIEKRLVTILATCSHKELRLFLERLGVGDSILRQYYPKKDRIAEAFEKMYASSRRREAPETHMIGPSKKQVVEGVVENLDSSGVLGALLDIVDEAIKYGRGLPSSEAQSAAIELERIRATISMREAGVSECPGSTATVQPHGPRRADGRDEDQLRALHEEFTGLAAEHNQQVRGYRFQRFVHTLLAYSNLRPRPAYRAQGEEVDGAFEFDGKTYLYEAKWQTRPVTEADLSAFGGKVERRLEGTRGVFFNAGQYSPTGVAGFLIGKRPSIVLLDAQHLVAVVEGRITFPELLRNVLSEAAVKRQIYIPVRDVLG